MATDSEVPAGPGESSAAPPAVRLATLEPEWVSEDGVHGVGLLCRCPCGSGDEEHRLFVNFQNPVGAAPSDAERPESPGWHRTGDTFETLTLNPSIRRSSCGWHGVITTGDVITVP